MCIRDSVNTVVLDKTGTVTEGTPAVASVMSLGSMDRAEVLAYAAALEKHSEHPIAAAIVRAAKESVSAHSVREFKSLTGAGVTGKVNYRDVAVGNVRLMREIGVSGEVGRRTPESVRQGTATE